VDHSTQRPVRGYPGSGTMREAGPWPLRPRSPRWPRRRLWSVDGCDHPIGRTGRRGPRARRVTARPRAGRRVTCTLRGPCPSPSRRAWSRRPRARRGRLSRTAGLGSRSACPKSDHLPGM